MFKRMIFTVSTLLLASWLFAGQAEYQDFDASAIVSAKYLETGSGAAAAGMGNAYIGLAEGAGSVYWNPAGLISMQEKPDTFSIYFSQNIWIMDMMASQVSLARNFRKIGNFALSLSYFHAGSIEKTSVDGAGDPLPLENQTYSPYSLVFMGSYAAMLEGDIGFGMNLKYLLDSIDGDAAHTAAFDIGIRYVMPFHRNLSLNITAKNFGGSFNGSLLPKEMAFAAGYRLSIGDYTIGAGYDVCGRVANNPVHRTGIEVKTPFFMVFRTGYQSDNTAVEEGFRNFTFGAGINLGDKYIDFAFEPYGELGAAYKVSFGGDF